jgi:uncharacterized protein YndB with AHSA1/START domain
VTELQLSVDLLHPPERVWWALTDPRLLSLWFVATDLTAVQGGVFRAFPPPGLAGLTAPFDVDVVEVSEPTRLVLRWRGDHLYSDVTWELTRSAQGCRLAITETGFFGVRGAQRQRDLGRTYQVLFGERLPATLDRLASGEIDLDQAQLDLRVAMPRRRDRAAVVGARVLAGDGRLRLLSLAGAAVLVVLLSTAIAVLMTSDSVRPQPPIDQAHGPGTALQPGSSESVPTTPSASANPSGGNPQPGPLPGAIPTALVSVLPVPLFRPPSAVVSAELTAGYKTIVLLGLGGFDTQVTVRNPSSVVSTGWTVVLTMPADRSVVNRSSTVVAMKQEGVTVTLTPVESVRAVPPGGTVTFTIRFRALLATARAVKSCTVDGRACTAA